MTLPTEFLGRLRSKVSIVDIASRWIEWDQKKSNPSRGDYWALCPFHEEKSPSFHVEDRKGFYYCFGCHKKGDVISFLSEKRGITSLQAMRQLAFLAGIESELSSKVESMTEYSLSLVEMKEIIVENFRNENFLEVGLLTGWAQYIRSHPRLLRSLNFGDPDYSGCVLDMLAHMNEAEDKSIEKLKDYISSKFFNEMTASAEVGNFSSTKNSLGYTFVRSRNDIIGVMMPFGGNFGTVYDAIKSSCETTPLPARQGNRIWI